MFPRIALVSLCLAAVAFGQQTGTLTAETHPSLPAQHCTKSGGCTTVNTKIVLDSNWRWLHSTKDSSNCYEGNTWNKALCPDPKTCAANCALDGADYSKSYGISTSGNALTLKFVTDKNVGSRVYLMADDSNYQMFKLLNQEFTMDVDMSNLPCGLNGAVYFSEMDQDGGMTRFPTNKAGAKYGTGYCDSQCPHDIKFINGEANINGWNGTSANSGSGTYGTCCAEMDIWEANKNAGAFTPHPCSVTSQTRCSGTQCGDGDSRYSGLCDKDGCDFNSYRMGDKSFLGPGKTIDTNSKFTVVTQFITNTGTSSGTLSEIRRIYVQNGKVYANSQSKVAGVTGNSLSDSFCAVQKSVFSNTNNFKTQGGMASMGASLGRGMVLALSLWDDYAANALWLDSTYPATSDPSLPGVQRGPCGTDTGVPADVEKNSPGASVIYSNIRWGDLDTTYTGTVTTTTATSGTTTSTGTTTSGSTTTKTTSTTSPTSTSGAAHYAQCGGTGWTGPTTCQGTYKCTVLNAYFSQCL